MGSCMSFCSLPARVAALEGIPSRVAALEERFAELEWRVLLAEGSIIELEDETRPGFTSFE